MKRTDWNDKMFLRTGMYQLDRNENCDAVMAEHVQLFIDSLDRSIIVQYPNLSDAYSSLPAFGFDPDNVLLTYGAEHAIRAVINFHRNLGSISFPSPTYGMLPVFAEMYGLVSKPVPYNDVFAFDVECLLSGDIIYLANPDNPTGAIVDIELIEQLCASRKIVILDETYCGYSNTTAIELINRYDNLYIVKSFSKSAGAAGIRLGMIVSNADNIKWLRSEKPAYEISAIACEYLKFMSSRVYLIDESIQRVLHGKELIESVLRRNGFICYKTHANFILVEFDQFLFRNISELVDVAVLQIVNKKYIRITAPDTETAMRLIDHGIFKRDDITWETGIVVNSINESLTSIGISLTDNCNRACSICPHGHGFKPAVDDMSKETAEAIAAEFVDIDFKGRVVIAGSGEPLLHDNILDIISIFNNKLNPICGFDLVTNGDCLTIDLIRDLVKAGIKRIMVSMHDGPEQIAYFNDLFASAGTDAYILREHWNKDSELFTNRCGYVAPTPSKPIKKVCHYPFYHIEIRSDGELVLCSQDWTRWEKQYNINDLSLKSIWLESDWLRNYRKKLICADRSMTPCNKCNVKGDLYGANSFKVWKECLNGLENKTEGI